MKTTVLVFALCSALLWLALGAYLVGAHEAEWIAKYFSNLKRPTSTAELGDSLAILGGLFSTVAVVLGLIAILLQGRELRLSTMAQTQQSAVMTQQIKQQIQSNVLAAYAARLQYLRSEMERLDAQIEKLVPIANQLPNGADKTEKWDIIRNSRNLFTDYKNQAKAIDGKISSLVTQSDA
jgi:hypothetical protein